MTRMADQAGRSQPSSAPPSWSLRANECDLRAETDDPDPREREFVFKRVEKGEPLGLWLRGLRVERVESGSMCDRILKTGDVIKGVSGQRISNQKELLARLGLVIPGRVMLQVLPADGVKEPRASKLGWCKVAPDARKVIEETPPKVAHLLRSFLEQNSESAKVEQSKAKGQATLAPMPQELVQSDVIERLPQNFCQNPNDVIVLNGEDICFHASRCAAYQDMGPLPWKALEAVVKYYEELGFVTQPVIRQVTVLKNPPPPGLAEKLVQCPVIDQDGRTEGRGADRIFVLRLAQTYRCSFVDNSNYREAAWQGQDTWPWLQQEGLSLKVGYIFDNFGNVVPARTVHASARKL